jgi:ribonuclease PH
VYDTVTACNVVRATSVTHEKLDIDPTFQASSGLRPQNSSIVTIAAMTGMKKITFLSCEGKFSNESLQESLTFGLQGCDNIRSQVKMQMLEDLKEKYTSI